MRITCAYSGLKLQISHFPAALDNREAIHPIFYIPQKKLLNYVFKWSQAELTPTDSYLLFLALLNSTELINWATPAKITPRTDSIVANNMESLARIISYTNVISHPAFHMPGIVIDSGTNDLSNANMWIRDWQECYHEFASGYIREKEQEKIKNREQILQNFIKSANKPIQHYARILAEWAAEACDFPKSPTLVNGVSVPLSEFWKSIIVKCCKEEHIFTILAADINELIEYCEENLEHGSIYAHTLMELLRAGQRRQINYLGLGDADISTATYQIISNETTIEDANKMAMIQAAPDRLLPETAYPSKIAFLRAKLAFGMKQEWLKLQEATTAIQQTNEAIQVIQLPNGKEI